MRTPNPSWTQAFILGLTASRTVRKKGSSFQKSPTLRYFVIAMENGLRQVSEGDTRLASAYGGVCQSISSPASGKTGASDCSPSVWRESRVDLAKQTLSSFGFCRCDRTLTKTAWEGKGLFEGTPFFKSPSSREAGAGAQDRNLEGVAEQRARRNTTC